MSASDPERASLLAAARAQDWDAVLRLAHTHEALWRGDREVAEAAGQAAIARGRTPAFDPAMLGRAVDYLGVAWKLGARGPDNLWPLALALYDLGQMDATAEVLRAYVEEVADPAERVRASAFGAQVFEVLGKYSDAVTSHQSGLAGLGEQATPVVRFGSYTNFHLARAYGKATAATAWQEGALAAWQALVAEERTTARAVALLRAAVLAAEAADGGVDVLPLGHRLLDEFPERPDASLAELGDLCELQAEFMSLCDRRGDRDGAEAAFETAGRLVARVRDRRAELQAELAECEGVLRLLTHNLGYLCRESGRLEQALALMEEAVALLPVIGPTNFFLAALSLQVAGDRARSLEYLRRSAEDPFWTHEGACDSLRRAFDADSAFDTVRDDPEFLEVTGQSRSGT